MTEPLKEPDATTRQIPSRASAIAFIVGGVALAGVVLWAMSVSVLAQTHLRRAAMAVRSEATYLRRATVTPRMESAPNDPGGVKQRSADLAKDLSEFIEAQERADIPAMFLPPYMGWALVSGLTIGAGIKRLAGPRKG